ncbi:MAG TPA: heavy metal translocating P-type ATPase [Gemmatimonadaceae bacterium]|nr:heavy metal translocating P-type ATPase [Gemmatimonadaceae bacterium]
MPPIPQSCGQATSPEISPVSTPGRSSEPPHAAGRAIGRGHRALPALTLAFIVGGLIALAWPPARAWADRIWMTGLVLCGAPVVWRAARDAIAGRFATDLVASLAIITAIPLGEPLAGLIVVLMQTGGESLERYAEGRASAAVRELERDAPRTGHRLTAGRVQDVPVESIDVGDLLLVRPGEMIPCDAVVVEGRSHVDTSRISGEPLPLNAGPGTRLLSGTVNAEGALTIRATALAGESQYARIVELVRTAQASRAPLQRVADRYAAWFTPVTLAVCLVAWLWSGDPVRVLAVLVVATPCPLILATPVAIIGGINRAARRQIIVRSGGALETLARVRSVALDKTGTVTIGLPRVSRVLVAGEWPESELLRLASAVEESSGHLLARTLVDEARERGIAVTRAGEIVEFPGRGVEGIVEGRVVTVGARSLLRERHPSSDADLGAIEPAEPGLRAYVAVDGRAAGIVEYADALRPGIREFLESLREQGVVRTVLVSGDHAGHTRRIADQVGITEARGDLLPAQKVDVVRELAAGGDTVLMVGDGTNDAPALSAAHVGVALAGHGGGIAAEAADVVLLIDEPGRVADALSIGRRTMRIAHQSILVGLGLSATAMVFAALGMIPPLAGALLQEGIDVAVIMNALRASVGGGSRRTGG